MFDPWEPNSSLKLDFAFTMKNHHVAKVIVTFYIGPTLRARLALSAVFNSDRRVG